MAKKDAAPKKSNEMLADIAEQSVKDMMNDDNKKS